MSDNSRPRRTGAAFTLFTDPMQYKDYYQTLGVDKTATPDEIKKAYRKLARQYHPDVSQHADASERMAEVNEAYAVLGDAQKRAAYDTVGAQAWAAGARSGDDVRPPPDWHAGFDFGQGHATHGGTGGASGADSAEFSEFFEHLFGRHARRAAQAGANAQARPLRGQDQHASIELDLADAYRGAERTLSLRSAPLADDEHAAPHTRTLRVNIPAGVKEGQLIRLAGQGHPGWNGGAAGDLFLQVQFRPDPRWHIDGRNVTQTLRVTPWEAALGAAVHATTPDGATLEVQVPPGSGTGRKLRLKGRGIPAASASGTAGDLYLRLEVAVPGPVTDAQKAAWAALRDAYPGFDPRRA